ncbi:PREDICTED: protein FAM9A [Tarenaya hassleriana]|uniref:protein FAM9A n=1 Tax=Tarenaya hassleriana TaxID=28532 RepID=UPI00053C1CF1|nr:PREDICTED: protein FAM9A [Tarenaya hassleriana]
MGSELNQAKKRFDLSMSRRTRKPLNNLFKETHQDISIASPPPEEAPHHGSNQEQDREQEQERKQEQEQEIDHKSLNQLMRGEEEGSQGETGGGGVNGKSSLGEHFSVEEKQVKMQIVTRKNNDGENGVKFRGIMGRYAKVLSGLIKAKHDTRRLSASKKKPIFRLK